MHRVKKSASAIVFLWTTLCVTLLGTASASAQTTEPDFPAGVACAFPMDIESSGGQQVMREFVDKDGNVVRTLAAGKGAVLTFTNVDTGETLTVTTGGSVTHITLHPDGSFTFVTTGHNVLILFPSDVPAGPSTTLTQGRVVFTIDTNGVFTVTEVEGRTTDICAALSS